MMNDSRLRRSLELAMAAHLPDDSVLDAETAELHEAWLALGALLPPAAEPIDEAPILARIESAHRDSCAPPRRTPVLARHGHWLVAAVALLIATGVVVTLRPAGTQPTIGGAPDPVATPSPDTAAGATWDDPLDEELLAAQQRLAQLPSGWRSPLTDADNLGQKINDLLSDLESETL